MARNPLIPRTPGEQAVDKLLNQTLPQLLQNQQRKQEREENIARADRIREEDIARDNERYKDKIEKENKDDGIRAQNDAYNTFIKAQQAYKSDNISLGDSYLDQSFKMYQQAGIAAPFTLETYKQNEVTNKKTLDTFTDKQNDFYLAKGEDVQTKLQDVVTHYENNSDILDYKTTIQPVLEHVLTNYTDPRYADIYDNVDFGALKGEIKSYSTYNAQMEYKPSDANFDSFVVANPDVTRPTDEQLRAHYYSQNKQGFQGAASTYLDSTMTAYETDDMSSAMNDMSDFEKKRIDVNFKNAGVTAVFGDGRGYAELNKKEKQEVTNYLSDRYGFPKEIIYTKKTEDKVVKTDEQLIEERKTRYLELSSKSFPDMSPAERTERAELGKEFGSVSDLRAEKKVQSRKNSAISKQEKTIERLDRKFVGFAELLSRYQDGKIRRSGGGALVLPQDLAYLQWTGGPDSLKRTVESYQAQLGDARDKLKKLKGSE